MAEDNPSNPFWGYSLRLYASGEVATLCLALQDGWGLDVNLLLYCLWHGEAGRSLSEESVVSASRACAAWRREVVQPLRGARRWMKGRSEGVAGRADSLRERIKALELAAEKHQQDWLADQAVDHSHEAPAAAAAANLALYLKTEELTPDEELTGTLARLLAEAFPDDDAGPRDEALRAALGRAERS